MKKIKHKFISMNIDPYKGKTKAECLALLEADGYVDIRYSGRKAGFYVKENEFNV